MKEFLLALILAAAGLHVSKATKEEEKESEVKYKGPVVYTNLPPPVLYFPNFPERPKFSNRGSDGDVEDKRIEYVPFPYKDLPLLVYQSQSQPPVHVVEKNPNSMKDDSSQHSSGYQTGPAVYRVAGNDQYGNEDSDSGHNPQSITATPSEKYINVGLSTSSIPSVDAQNQQFISIGLTSIQSQGNDLQGQSVSALQGSSHVSQTNNMYNQMQYSGNQNIENSDYSSDSSESSGQNGPAYVYFTNQYSNQNPEPHAQVPVEQLTQAIQSYLLQQSQSGMQQTLASYSGSQDSSSSAENSPTQHVGITIIRQPSIADSSDHGANEPQYSAPPPPPPPSNVQQPPVQNNQGYDNTQQQFVSIGVYPINVPGNDYADPQQYYNVISPVSDNQYQNTNDDYGQSHQNYESPPSPPPPPPQNENSQTAGYQVISIDLSALKNQNAGQQKNPALEYSQPPVQRSPPPPAQPPPSYRPPNENENSYGTREKEFQQILIQIPNNILSEQSDKPQRGRGTYETPYTGTAQVTNVIRDSNKPANRPSGKNGPNYSRPVQQRPPPVMQHSERPRNPVPQNNIISSGINIAIIKQTDSTNNSPVYKNLDQRPPPHHSPVRSSTYPMANRVPPPPNFSHRPERPMFGYPNRPASSASTRYNNEREVPNYGGHHYSISETRYHTQRPFAQYKNKQPVPQIGGHPGIYSSSNHHYTAVNPTGVRPPSYGRNYPVHQPMSSVHASATKTQAQFVPSPGVQSMASSISGTESVEQVLTNNIGEINFDEINAFLSPSYDLFGPLTNGPDKKKIEEETKLLQKVTSDLLTHDLNPASLVPPMPSYPIVKPPPHIMNAPFPYKFWEHRMLPPGHMIPPGHMVPPAVMPGNDRIRMMKYYSHMQHPYAANNRPFNPIGKGNGRKRGLGKGRLRKKLAALRTSIRHKSKIAPRLEEADEGSEILPDQYAESSIYEIAAPRSTIIKRDGPGLDGITIPLRPEHMLLSRISMDGMEKADDENEEDIVPLPPIIVYKGTKPPIEIYGSKSDIEGEATKNETQKSIDDKSEDGKESSKNASSEESKDLSAEESLHFYSSEGSRYIDYLYSMLPELMRNSFHRRLDSSSDKWLPVSSVPYAVAEDNYDRNKTTAQKSSSFPVFGSMKESTASQNSSSNVQSSIEENVEELFSLLGKEEISDLIKQ